MKNQNHTSHFTHHTSQKGITLIALIITIIVMLILVGVTINVALNGGLFNKAEEATTKTKIAQVKEALTIKKAEVLADKNGEAPEDYGITLDKLNIPEQLKTEYGSKLIISKDGILYYDESVVKNKGEQDTFKSMGIQEYVETNTGDSYTFTVGDIMKKGRDATDITRVIPVEEFWPEDVSEKLKNNAFDVEFKGVFVASNLTCSDSRITNPFAIGGDQDFEDDWIIYMGLYNNEIRILINLERETTGIGWLNEDNYIGSGFENLEITIGLPQ